MRSFSRLIFVSAAAALAACGGAGGSPQALPPSGLTPANLVSAGADGSIEITGTIVSLWAGGFTAQGGAGVGYIHVYVNSSTAVVGPALFSGEKVDVIGIGTVSTSIAASKVTQLAASVAPSSASTFGATVSSVNSPTDYTVNGGGTTGYYHVYANAATVYTGGIKPLAGAYVEVTGTGSTGTSVTAAVITAYAAAPGTVTYTGTVVSPTSYGFTLDVDAADPAVPIVTNSLTVVGGGVLTAGAVARVTGTGSESTAIVAVQIAASSASPAPSAPTPAPIPMTHVLTGAYLGTPLGPTAIPWSTAAPFLTWAQTGPENANAISAAGIKTQFYIDANRLQTNDALYTSTESNFAHACDGTRVTDVYVWNGTPITQYVPDLTNTQYQQVFANRVAQVASEGHFDAMFEDDAGPLSGFAAENPFSPGLPCNYTDAAWLAAGQALNQASPVPIFFNGLNEVNGHSTSLSVGLLSSPNTIAGNYEGCYADGGTPKIGGWLWQTIENTELAVAALHKTFGCMLKDTTTASSALDGRMYAYASFLLTYDPNTSLLWEFYTTPSGFDVQPETQLVALDPKTPAPSDVSALASPGGAYAREYGACYIAGTYAGPCAAAVNPSSSSSVPFPLPQYAHTLVISGSGVLDGGSIATSGPAPPLYLPPLGAAIVFP